MEDKESIYQDTTAENMKKKINTKGNGIIKIEEQDIYIKNNLLLKENWN